MYTPASSILARLSATISKPRERISVSEWADRYRVLSPEVAAEPGPWRTARVPYLREVMDSFFDPAVAQISLMFSAQTAKTEAMINMMFAAIDVLGMSQMFMFPTENDVQEFNAKRLKPSVDACEKIKGHLIKTDPITNSGIKCRGVYVDFAWSKSPRTQKGKPRGIIFADEIDEYEDPNALERIRNRMKTFASPKMVVSSTPTDENVGIHAQFQAGDRRRFFVPCPYCNEMQTLNFNRLKWEGGIAAREDDVRRGTWYECIGCGERIAESQKQGMLNRGQWQSEEPEYVSSHRSYHLSELYSPFPSATWGGIAAEFVRHKGNPPATFYTERLGEPYVARGRRLESHALRMLALPVKDGGYLKRTIPEPVRVLIAAVDVQHNRFYFVCRGFAEKASASYLIDEREIKFTNPSTLDEIAHFVRSLKYEQLRNVNGAMQKVPWRPVVWGIDSGDRTREVYELVGKFYPSSPIAQPIPRVFAVKGRGTTQIDQPWTETAVSEMRDGTKLRKAGSGGTGGIRLLNVNGPVYKEAIHNEFRGDPRLGLAVDDKGAAVGVVQAYLPGDVSDEYLHHMTSEEYRQTSTKARGGFGKFEWCKRPGVTRNDFFDCEQYVRALADRFMVKALIKCSTGFAVLDVGGGGGGGGAQAVPMARPQAGFSIKKQF